MQSLEFWLELDLDPFLSVSSIYQRDEVHCYLGHSGEEKMLIYLIFNIYPKYINAYDIQ